MDFKAGNGPSKSDGKMRWTPAQLKNGFQKGVSLEDAIKQDMVIKLDFAIPLNGTFVEVSEIYNTQYQTKKTNKQIEIEMEGDVVHFVKENNSMKALKRFFSLLMLEKGHIKVKSELVNFFNSEVGLVNKVANDLEILHSLRKQISTEDYRNNIQMCKERVAVIAWVNASKFNTDSVPHLIKYLRSKVNPLAKDELRRLR